MRILFIVLLLLSVSAPVLAETPEERARITALRERVQELDRQQIEVQSHIAALGHGDTAAESIRNVQGHFNENQRQMEALAPVLEQYKVTHAELEQMRRQVNTKTLHDFTLKDAREEATEEVVERTMEEGLKAAARAETHLVGPLALIGDVVEHFGLWGVRHMSAQELAGLVKTHGEAMVTLGTFMAVLENEKAQDTRTIAQLRDLKEQYDEIQEELVPARARLANLTGHAHEEADVRRVRDFEGDEKLRQQTESENRRLIIRPCGPPSNEPRNFGVRPSGKVVTPMHKGGAEKGGEEKSITEKKANAAEDQCVDLAGLWTFQTTHYISPKPMPPVRVEIVEAEAETEDAPAAYDIFMPDRKRAQNGAHMRCTLSGLQLNCRVRALSPSCPVEKQAWDNITLTVADDGIMSGEHTPGYSTDGNAADKFCTAIAYQAPGEISYRFVPVEADAK